MSSQIESLKIVWNAAEPFKAAIPLSSQPQYATILLSLALALSAVLMVTDKKGVAGTLKSLILALVASLAFGFGGVFLIDAVGVYT